MHLAPQCTLPSDGGAAAPGLSLVPISVPAGFLRGYDRSFWLQLVASIRSLPEATPYFRDKFASLADPVQGPRRWGRLRYELACAGLDVDSKVVLDAGCGSGVYSVAFALMGATRVHAMDYFEPNVRALGRLATRHRLPIEATLTDVACTGLPDSSVDVVYCLEAISHLHDADAFLREVARLLRRRGALIIADANNGANPLIRHAIYAMWRRSEQGPFTPRAFPEGASLPFVFRRWMMIRRAYPQLRDEEVFQLGMRTAGRGAGGIRSACEDRRSGVPLPDVSYRYGVSPRRPEDGQRNEEPYHPQVLARRLAALGLQAVARPHFGFSRWGFLRWLNTAGAALAPVSLMVAPRYLVIGRRAETALRASG